MYKINQINVEFISESIDSSKKSTNMKAAIWNLLEQEVMSSFDKLACLSNDRNSDQALQDCFPAESHPIFSVLSALRGNRTTVLMEPSHLIYCWRIVCCDQHSLFSSSVTTVYGWDKKLTCEGENEKECCIISVLIRSPSGCEMSSLCKSYGLPLLKHLLL